MPFMTTQELLSQRRFTTEIFIPSPLPAVTGEQMALF